VRLRFLPLSFGSTSKQTGDLFLVFQLKVTLPIESRAHAPGFSIREEGRGFERTTQFGTRLLLVEDPTDAKPQPPCSWVNVCYVSLRTPKQPVRLPPQATLGRP